MIKARFFFCVLLILILIYPVYSIQLEKFRYTREIKVDCNNFIGYAAFSASDDLLAKSRNLGNLYIDTEYFVNYGAESKTSNWYVQDSNVGNLDELKSVLDGNVRTYYALEKPNNELDLELNNPNPQGFDKIIINLKDSEIMRVEFYDANNVQLKSHLIKNDFTYSYFFYPRVNINSIKIKLFFENILKVAEIGMYAQERPTVYLFVNNECNKIYRMYYGDSGGSERTYARHDMTKVIPAILLEESTNQVYNYDFDDDIIPNEQDNCPSVPNKDQEDLNYNSVGDACEDFDHDSVINSKDNCADKPNYDQSDVDRDGVGDVCDTVDNRFSERYRWVFYVGGALAVLIFLYVAYGLLKQKPK